MPLVFGGDPSNGCCGDLFGVEDDSSKKIVIYSSLSGEIPLSGDKNGLLCITGAQYYGELGMINPSPFPIYLWLCGSKPRVPQDCFLFSELCDLELEICMVISFLNLQISVVA